MTTLRLAILCAAGCLHLAAATIYSVSIDTSALTAGTAGYFYSQFAPGLGAGAATATIMSFGVAAPGSFTAVPDITTGGVTGSLPGPLILDNSGGVNDALNAVLFSTGLSFIVTLESPVGSAPAGSAFSFALFAPDGVTPLLTSDPDGFQGIISYDGDGVFTATALSGVTTITAEAVPEPCTAFLTLAASSAVLCLRRRR